MPQENGAGSAGRTQEPPKKPRTHSTAAEYSLSYYNNYWTYRIFFARSIHFLEMAEADASRLFRIRKTVHKMLHDRGYVVSQEDLEQTKDEASFSAAALVPGRFVEHG